MLRRTPRLCLQSAGLRKRIRDLERREAAQELLNHQTKHSSTSSKLVLTNLADTPLQTTENGVSEGSGIAQGTHTARISQPVSLGGPPKSLEGVVDSQNEYEVEEVEEKTRHIAELDLLTTGIM